MMRKSKMIKIDSREITVRELTVRQVWGLFQEGGEMSARLDTLLELSCQGLSREEAMDMAPSELMQVWAEFKEVNSDFLGLAKAAGLEALVMTAIEEAKTGILSAGLSAPLPAPGMG